MITVRLITALESNSVPIDSSFHIFEAYRKLSFKITNNQIKYSQLVKREIMQYALFRIGIICLFLVIFDVQFQSSGNFKSALYVSL